MVEQMTESSSDLIVFVRDNPDPSLLNTECQSEKLGADKHELLCRSMPDGKDANINKSVLQRYLFYFTVIFPKNIPCKIIALLL